MASKHRLTGNGGSPEQLEREIEDTRHEIESTLEELGDRLSPGQLLDQGLSYLRDSGAGAGSKAFFLNFGRSVRDNPLAVTLATTGLTWLMNARGGGEPSAGTGRPWREEMGDATSDIARRARQTGSQLQRAQTEVREGARRQAERARGAWTHMLDEQPLLLGLAGMALGALVGGTLPATEREDELLGEARDEVLASAAEKGREAAEDVRRKAEDTRRETETTSRQKPS